MEHELLKGDFQGSAYLFYYGYKERFEGVVRSLWIGKLGFLILIQGYYVAVSHFVNVLALFGVRIHHMVFGDKALLKGSGARDVLYEYSEKGAYQGGHEFRFAEPGELF